MVLDVLTPTLPRVSASSSFFNKHGFGAYGIREGSIRTPETCLLKLST